jgi:hypothetical protein
MLLSPALLGGLQTAGELSPVQLAGAAPVAHNANFFSQVAQIFQKGQAGPADKKPKLKAAEAIDTALPDQVDAHAFAPPGIN